MYSVFFFFFHKCRKCILTVKSQDSAVKKGRHTPLVRIIDQYFSPTAAH